MSKDFTFLAKEIEQLQSRIHRKESELDDLRDALAHVVGAFDYLARSNEHQPYDQTLMQLRKSGSISSAIMLIASMKGTISSYETRKMLVDAGMIEDARRGHRKVWNHLSRLTKLGHLVRIKEGMYRRIDSQMLLPSSSGSLSHP